MPSPSDTTPAGRAISPLAALRDRGRDAAAHLSTLLDSYGKIRHFTESLCSALAVEDYVIQSHAEASPVKWHLAHASWFFEELVLQRFAPHYRPCDPDYRTLFRAEGESGATSVPRSRRGLLSRPTVEQTFAYRAYVDEHMRALLARAAPTEELWRAVTLGLHHEQQHQELLLIDLKHAFSVSPLLPLYCEALPIQHEPLPPLTFVACAAGLTEIGHDGRGFCFENELPRHPSFIAPFRLANRLISNEEYRSFVTSGGYTHEELWLPEGWDLAQAQRWERPLYWSESLEHEFGLTGVRELDPNAPVSHVSYYEADAFARWTGARLPSEQEWESAAAALPVQGNFVEEGHWCPIPARGGAGQDLLQLFGDAWEWTRSSATPYPGCPTREGPSPEHHGCFGPSQAVLRGGSCITARSHVRHTYRHRLRPEARWQVTSLRLAMDG